MATLVKNSKVPIQKTSVPDFLSNTSLLLYSLVLIAYLVPSPFLFFVLQQYGTGQDRSIGDDSLQKPAQLTLSSSAGDSDQQATATGTNSKVISSYFSIPTNQLAVLLTEC